MAAIDFTDQVTIVPASWLDHVNNHVYDGKNPSFVTSTGSANAQIVTLPSSEMTALEDGQVVFFKAGYTNSGATTLTVIGESTTGAVAVQFEGAACIGGEIQANSAIGVIYLNSVWNIIHNSNWPYQTAAQVTTTLADYVLASSLYQWLCFAVSDESTAITTGTAKITFRLPACTVLAVRSSLTTSSSSGLPTVDINEAGVSILSTALSIDANELTSTTAATPAVISDSTIAEDAQMTVDIDTAGTGAKGLKVYLKVHWT